MSAFSSKESASLERKADIIGESELTSENKLEYNYELDRCTKWIEDIKAQKVCLQFPDALLGDSVNVALQLEKRIDGQVYILGDTSYGSCCVDEVAAQHVNADAVIHFGSACLSPTSRLPTLYIFEKNAIDLTQFESSFRTTFETDCRILILYEVSYLHIIDEVSNKLSTHYPNLVISKLSTTQTDVDNPDSTRKLGREFSLPANRTLDEYKVLFIGKDGRTLSNFVLDMDSNTFYLYDPTLANNIEHYEYARSKFLMRRLYLVERIKDAGTLGIVIGTLGVSNYLAAVERIKELAKLSKKKCYIIAVGKPNVPKLANFPEIDVFVLVACPENCLLDAKEYYKPIVTLYDVELAVNKSREFSQAFVTDFRQLLLGGSSYSDLSQQAPPDELSDMSLISGKLRHVPSDPASSESDRSDAVSVRAGTTVSVMDAGGVFLANRSWRGLEQELGRTEVTLAEKGRSGIAQNYAEMETQE